VSIVLKSGSLNILEPCISAGERPQTYALDRTATGTGPHILMNVHNFIFVFNKALYLCL